MNMQKTVFLARKSMAHVRFQQGVLQMLVAVVELC